MHLPVLYSFRRCPYAMRARLALQASGQVVEHRESDVERTEFIIWIAANPQSGDVVPGTNGCRKVRWGRSGSGKRGGARVIYFIGADGRIGLLIVYAKAKFDQLPAEFLAKLKEEVLNG